MDSLRGLVQRELDELNKAFNACPGGPPSALALTWRQELTIANNWASQTTQRLSQPTTWNGPDNATLYSQGQGIEATLRANWYPRMRDAGCPIGQDPSPPEPPSFSTENPGTLMSGLGEVARWLPWVGILLLWRELKR